MSRFEKPASRKRHRWWKAGALLALALAIPRTVHAQTAEPPAPTETAPPETRAPAEPEASAPPEPEASVQEEYRAIVTDAIEEFKARRWAEARALFLRAHQLWPSARTLRTLGMTSFELREYPRALSELQQALSDPRRPLDSEQRAETLSLIERAKAFVGSYRVQLSPVQAELWVDGQGYVIDNQAPLQLSVGSHELVARAPGHHELRRRINVQGGEEQNLRIDLIPIAPETPVAPRPEPAVLPVAVAPPPAEHDIADEAAGGRVWTWVAAGSAVALGAASTALWLVSDSKYDDLYGECEPRLSTADPCKREETNADTIENLQTAHAVTLGLSIVAGAAAVVLFVVEGQDEGRNTAVTLSPSGAAVTTHF